METPSSDDAIRQTTGIHETSSPEWALELDAVTCILDNNQTVLNDLSLRVAKGEICSVLGLSGVGKSTLLKTVAALLPVTEGRVHVLGKDITTIEESALNDVRKRIGVVFQGGALFDFMTVRENVTFAPLEHRTMSEMAANHLAEKLLATVGMAGTQDLLPGQLSGGMRKRVAIARALALEPELILYDEPTSGLDPVMSGIINDLIVSMRDQHGVTSITVTHDLKSAALISDSMAILHKGQIVASGRHMDLEQNPNPLVQQFLKGNPHGPLTDNKPER